METILEVGLGNALAATVLALGAAGLSRFVRRPALVHTLWVLVLLKLVTPPLVPFALPWAVDREGMPAAPEGPRAAEELGRPGPDGPEPIPPDPRNRETMAGDAAAPEPDPVPAVTPPFPWRSHVGACWLAGTGVWAVWLTGHVRRFRRVLRHARRAPGALQGEAEALARRLGVAKCPTVWLVPGAVCPMVWGLGRPLCLLFPSGLLQRLDADGRAALLVHELAHVRRRDHWVRALELVVTGLYWWHPAVWWARREVHEAEELCCDAWAVWASGGAGRPYAVALLQAVAFVSQAPLPLPAGASGVGQVSHLKRRLAMVMQGGTPRSLSWAGVGLVLGLGLLLLPLFPAWGQERPAAAPAAKDARDQQIEALKKAIDVLENQKKQEPARDSVAELLAVYGRLQRARAEAVATEDLQAELRALEQAIAVKKKELQDLEARVHAVRTQLGQLGPSPQKTAPAPVDVARPITTPPAKAPFERTPPPAGAVDVARPITTPPAKAHDLDQKLDRLLKEVEDLRREIHKNRPMERSPGAADGLPLPPPVKRPTD